MAGVGISFEGLDAIQRGLAQAPARTQRELLSAMTEATLLVQREATERTPRVTGLTARSLTSDAYLTPLGVEGTVGSTQISMIALELGTKPHMPPSEALQPWVRAVLGISEPQENKRVAFLVARKIAKHGTQPRHILRDTLATLEGQVTGIFERAADRIGEQLLGDGA